MVGTHWYTPSHAPKLGVGDLVALEDRVLVHAAVLFDVLPAADLWNTCGVKRTRSVPSTHLHKVHEEKLPSKEATKVDIAAKLQVGDVLGLACGVPKDTRVEDFLAKDAGHAQHGPAAVLELGLTVPFQRIGVAAEAQGIPAIV